MLLEFLNLLAYFVMHLLFDLSFEFVLDTDYLLFQTVYFFIFAFLAFHKEH